VTQQPTTRVDPWAVLAWSLTAMTWAAGFPLVILLWAAALP
jgi:hypothetical protein